MAIQGSRKGSILSAIVFSGLLTSFLWVVLSESPLFHLDSRLGFLAAILFAFLAFAGFRTAFVALDLETHVGTSVAAQIFGGFEAACYVGAAAAGFFWLLGRVMGKAGPTDDIQRAGLWVLGFLAAGVLLRVLGVVRPDQGKNKT